MTRIEPAERAPLPVIDHVRVVVGPVGLRWRHVLCHPCNYPLTQEGGVTYAHDMSERRPTDIIGQIRFDYAVQKDRMRNANDPREEEFHRGVMDGLMMAAHIIGFRIEGTS